MKNPQDKPDEALSKKDQNKALFYIFYTGLRDMVISEKDFVNSLHQLYKDGFRTYHIDNYYEILTQMQHNNLKYAYNFSFMLGQHNLNYKDLCQISDVFPDIISKTNNIHEKTRLNIPYIQRRLKEKERIMRAFERFDELVDTEYTEFTRRDLFEQNYSIEIIRRLHQLVNAFGLDSLRLMNVQLITITEVKNLKYNELKNYYRECIERIKDCIVYYIKLCKEFQILVPRLEHIFGC